MDEEITDFCTAEYPRLVGMLGLYCGDRAVAEELAQEALARAWRHWKKVRGLDHPAAWLHRVALNLANSHFRRLGAERRARERSGHVEDRMSDLDTADKQAVQEAVAALPKRQRTALVLRYYLDLPYAEIAEVMEAPEATVKSLVRRAIARLRSESGLTEPVEVFDVT
ncbi:MAG: RNA polymerase sigma factor [Actinomycetota bacterium]